MSYSFEIPETSKEVRAIYKKYNIQPNEIFSKATDEEKFILLLDRINYISTFISHAYSLVSTASLHIAGVKSDLIEMQENKAK